MTGAARIIRTTAELQEVCAWFLTQEFVCVDTEFARERSYWPVLCLVQLGAPSGRREDAVLVDPLAGDMDLGPLFDLMHDDRILKIFHSGSQDFEIFAHFGHGVPRPVFDTQVGAAFCGYGHQVAYQSIVQDISRHAIDKGSRVTHWNRRPLTPRQMRYALDDVLYLPRIYRSLRERIGRRRRKRWVEEEMRSVLDPERYRNDPARAWTRLRTRSRDRRFLAILREVAAWREREAQRRDIPRQRVLGDAVLVEIARLAPCEVQDLSSLRLLRSKPARLARDGDGILEAVRRGADCAEEALPVPSAVVRISDSQTALASLLKVLLRAMAADHGIAEPIVATAEEIELLAMDAEADLPLLQGWRRDVFGEELLRLCRGEVALTVSSRRVVSVEMPPGGPLEG